MVALGTCQWANFNCLHGLSLFFPEAYHLILIYQIFLPSISPPNLNISEEREQFTTLLWSADRHIRVAQLSIFKTKDDNLPQNNKTPARIVLYKTAD